MASEPFDLGALTAKAKRADSEGIASVASWDFGEDDADYLRAVLPDRLLALHAALVRYRQELQARIEEVRHLKRGVDAEFAYRSALATFDQAVTL